MTPDTPDGSCSGAARGCCSVGVLVNLPTHREPYITCTAPALAASDTATLCSVASDAAAATSLSANTCMASRQWSRTTASSER